MKHLETTSTKVPNFFSRALHAVTTSVSSLLTWISLFISVGFAIIAVVILGVLLDVMVRITNYKNGTQYQTEVILKDLLTSLWKQSVEKTKAKVELPEEFTSLCAEKIPATGTYAFKYLQRRGVTEEDILKWKIGYCFSGEYRNRIIIPSFDEDGDCSYFIARSYSGDSYKYKNPRASKDIVFNELFIDWNSDLVLVEGVFDALVAGNAVPILGSTLRSKGPNYYERLYGTTPQSTSHSTRRRREKERRIIKMLLEYDIELYKIDVTGYEDVGSMPKQVFEERKNNATFIDGDNYLLMNLLSAI